MRLSSLADYAVVIMSAASRHCGGAKTSASELADETGIPLPTVQKLVSRLTHAGLLRSSRGAAGGLKLARPAAAISLADIVEAIEGPIAMTACVDSGKHDCVMEGSCTVQPHWPVVNNAVRNALDGVKLTQLVPSQIPPGTGGWHAKHDGGGGLHDHDLPHAPSTTALRAAVPLPVPGRI